jgi:hypothetical protein
VGCKKAQIASRSGDLVFGKKIVVSSYPPVHFEMHLNQWLSPYQDGGQRQHSI